MNKKIVANLPDGKVLSVSFAKTRADFDTDGAYDAYVLGSYELAKAKSDPVKGAYKDAVNAEIFREDQLPPAAWLGAWKKESGSVTIDMVKAREIHRGRIEAAAEQKAAKLVRDEQKADDEDDQIKKQEVKAERRALRQEVAALNLDVARTLTELVEIWPAELG